MKQIRKNINLFQITHSKSFKLRLRLCIVTVLYRGLQLLALVPTTRWPILQEMLCGVWIVEIFLSLFFGVTNFDLHREKLLSDFSTLLLFLLQAGGHLTILLESVLKRKLRAKIQQHFQRLHGILCGDSDPLNGSFTSLLAFLLILFGCSRAYISYAVHMRPSKSTSFYWHSLITTIALQWRMIDFLTAVVVANEYISFLYKSIRDIGEANLRQSKIWNLKADTDECDKSRIVGFKHAYSEMQSLFELMNASFGSSLLVASIVCFIDFLNNSYWIFLAIMSSDHNNGTWNQNLGFVLTSALLLIVVCWHCQKCFNKSCMIGCLVFKLAKPYGSKNYNNLVTDLSLQVLHQRLTITAKGFFDLNLKLLGSMIAAIVTYLVILIQFMLTEGPSSKSTNSSNNALN